MNLKTLRYFVAVADRGNLTAAAAAIPIAQPALSRQIRELEVEMGVTLLQRLPRGMRLTPAGATFYESAQRILAEAARLSRKLADSPHKGRAQVAIGISPTLARLLLPRLFENCMAAQDRVKLRAREAFTPALREWLERSLIDLAVLTNPEPTKALSFQPLLGEPFALISHTRMHIDPVVSINRLARFPLLMTSLHHGLVDRQLAGLGKSLQVHAEIDSVDSIRELVTHGRWATIMPVSVFRDHAQQDGLVMSEISGVQLNRLLVLATPVNPRPSSALALVHDLIIAEFARLERRGIFSFATTGIDQAHAPEAPTQPRHKRI